MARGSFDSTLPAILARAEARRAAKAKASAKRKAAAAVRHNERSKARDRAVRFLPAYPRPPEAS